MPNTSFLPRTAIGRIFTLFLIFLFTLPSQLLAHTIDLNKRDLTSLEQMIADLSQAQVVFIGERHDVLGHHQAQLQIIQELQQAGVPIAIGLEMFRKEGQGALDRWLSGDLDEDRFSRVFSQHWSHWPLYREIFVYAREHKIPLVGLNIPRELVSQVARHGFSSLSAEQQVGLPLAACIVSPEYRAFLRGVQSGHPLDDTAFEHFCEAQILWDASMAVHVADYLKQFPQKTMVVLAGNGHAWKHGILEHLGDYGDFSTRVVLPKIPGWLDLDHIDENVADYLLQGVEEGPLH